MVRKKHLTLVYSNQEQDNQNENTFNKIKSFFEDLRYLFVSQNKKIESLRLILINMYRDYEITSGQADIPYFVRAENKINKILQEGKINYYYKKLRKFQNYMDSI